MLPQSRMAATPPRSIVSPDTIARAGQVAGRWGATLAKPENLRTVSRLREKVSAWRAMHQTVALVPTMGDLHDGHLSLMKLGAANADKVITSIFVNPTQFGAGEDFAAYPRTLDHDLKLLAETGSTDAVFLPSDDEIYPNGLDGAFGVSVPELGNVLCGAYRPGHFDGVATVVLRLINIVSPDFLVMGRKDYQQLIIIKRMIADLRYPVEVVAGETQRDEDGLAISSRNRYLETDERRAAPKLHATLQLVKDALAQGQQNYRVLEDEAMRALKAAGFEPDYVTVRRSDNLGEVNGSDESRDLVVLAAAWLGKARLIDNVRIKL